MWNFFNNKTKLKFLVILNIFFLLPFRSFAVISTGGVSCWSFDESSGNATDYLGITTLTNNNATPYVAGKINNGGDLESGSSQYFSGTNGGTYDLTSGTIAVWVKSESLANSSGIVETSTGSGAGGFYLDGRATGAIRFGFGAGNHEATAPILSLSNGTYYLVIATWSPSGKEIFVNNTSVGTDGTAETMTAGTTFNVGRYPAGGDYFDGIIDNVIIFNKVLSSGERGELYNAGAGEGCSTTFAPPAIYGCTNPTASNYNASATVEDGSCALTQESLIGSTNFGIAILITLLSLGLVGLFYNTMSVKKKWRY